MNLKILITADPELPVPPKFYGGIERIIYELITGLIEKGHKVVLLANENSKASCELVKYYGSSSSSIIQTINNMLLVSKLCSKERFDVIHSFGRMAYLLPVLRSSIPKIQTYQRHITKKNIKVAQIIGTKNLTITACSSNCIGKADIKKFSTTTVHNFVDINKFKFYKNNSLDSPLVFLGRLDKIKGAHTAIEIAKRTGRKLIIAGNITSDSELYFNNEIKPQCDQNFIKYIGPVNDEQKNELLGNASALLFPIEWDEPFGIVMAEALACGTPVIAYNRGSVPEVIADGVNGFICKTQGEMVDAVKNLNRINRSKCRDIAQQKFSKDVIIDQYEKLYFSLIN